MEEFNKFAIANNAAKKFSRLIRAQIHRFNEDIQYDKSKICFLWLYCISIYSFDVFLFTAALIPDSKTSKSFEQFEAFLNIENKTIVRKMLLFILSIRNGLVIIWIFCRFSYAAGDEQTIGSNPLKGLEAFLKEIFNLRAKDKRFDDFFQYCKGSDKNL